MSVVSPSLFLGLGDRGLEVARSVSAYIREHDPHLSRLHASIGLNALGAVLNLNNNSDSIFGIEGLHEAAQPGTWAHNYNVFIDYEKDFSDLVERLAQEVNHPKAVQELEDAGIAVDRNFNLYVFSTISDAVGSAVLLPSLAFIEKTLRRLVNPTVNLLLLNPNLFPESEQNDDHLIRSYCCMAELDWISENPEWLLGDNSFLFSNIWLLENGTERNDFLSSYEELMPMIAETLLLILSRRISVDDVADAVYSRQIAHKPAQYASFGLKKLLFPVDRLLEAITCYIVQSVLGNTARLVPDSIDRGRAHADVHRLLYDSGLDRIQQSILERSDGTQIWRDFAYTGDLSDNTSPDDFLTTLETQFQDFVNSSLQEFYEQISTRRDDMLDAFRKLIDDAVMQRIDEDNSLSLSRTEGFLAALLRRDSGVFRGDPPEESMSLCSVRDKIFAYFHSELKLDEFSRKLDELQKRLDSAVTQLQNAQSATVDIETDEPETAADASETDSAAQSIDQIREEVRVTRAAIEDVEQRLARGEEIIEDQDLCWQKIIKEPEGRFQDDLDDLTQRLRKCDGDLREAHIERETLEDAKNRFVRTMFLIMPIVLLALAAAVIVVLPLTTAVSAISSIKFSVTVVVLLLIVHLVWSGHKYIREISTPLRKLDGAISNLGITKKTTMIDIKDFKVRLLKRRYDYYRFRQLLEWYKEGMDYVVSMREALTDFSAHVTDYADKARANWEALDFSNTLFVRHIIREDDVPRYVSMYSSLDTEMSLFFRETKFSHYFQTFRHTGNIDDLGAAFHEFTENGYRSIREMSIEDAIREKEGAADSEAIDRLIQNFYSSIQAYTRIGYEQGIDQSESIVYIGVPDVRNSRFSDILESLGRGNAARFYPFRSPHEIVGLKLKIGFPAFYLSSLTKAHSLFSGSKQQQEYFCHPDWAVGDLIPSNLALGDEDDEFRRVAVISWALAIVEKDSTGFTFDNGSLGNDISQFIKYLNTVKGTSDYLKLKTRIEEVISDPGRSRVLVLRFLESHTLDETDKNILSKFLTEMDPLT